MDKTRASGALADSSNLSRGTSDIIEALERSHSGLVRALGERV